MRKAELILCSFIPFKSSFSSWSLPFTACATARAASSVISPNDRLSSWRKMLIKNLEKQREIKTFLNKFKIQIILL